MAGHGFQWASGPLWPLWSRHAVLMKVTWETCGEHSWLGQLLGSSAAGEVTGKVMSRAKIGLDPLGRLVRWGEVPRTEQGPPTPSGDSALPACTGGSVVEGATRSPSGVWGALDSRGASGELPSRHGAGQKRSGQCLGEGAGPNGSSWVSAKCWGRSHPPLHPLVSHL